MITRRSSVFVIQRGWLGKFQNSNKEINFIWIKIAQIFYFLFFVPCAKWAWGVGRVCYTWLRVIGDVGKLLILVSRHRNQFGFRDVSITDCLRPNHGCGGNFPKNGSLWVVCNVACTCEIIILSLWGFSVYFFFLFSASMLVGMDCQCTNHIRCLATQVQVHKVPTATRFRLSLWYWVSLSLSDWVSHDIFYNSDRRIRSATFQLLE